MTRSGTCTAIFLLNLIIPVIDGLLDDEIWRLGDWHGDFTQQQPYAGARGSENTYIKVLYDRSNLVFRWEFKPGSTLYLVWTHERSGYESEYRPVSDIKGELFRIMGDHVLMVKMNFWFSV